MESLAVAFVTLAHGAVFQLLNDAPEKLHFFQKLKYLLNKQQNKRNRNDIAGNTDRNRRGDRHLQQFGDNQSAQNKVFFMRICYIYIYQWKRTWRKYRKNAADRVC